jgi:signal transduction histidine kinase/DNA-binding response OmpR family regulator/ligand-binding sensor domain-containing protein
MKKAFIFAMLLGCAGAVWGQPYPYRFNYLTVDEGLSHTDASCLVQDTQGYIWIATLFGLDRFDGHVTKRFYNNNTPLNNALNNRVRYIALDRDGHLWLCTEGGFQCFDAKTEKYTDYALPGDEARLDFRKLIAEDNHLIYALATNELQLLHAQSAGKAEVLPLALPAGVHFTDMVSGPSGVVYLSSEQGFWILDKDRRFKNVPIPGCPEHSFDQINVNGEGNILLLKDGQLFLVNPSSGAVLQQHTCSPGAYIKNIAEDSKSNYWLNLGSSLLCLDAHFTPLQTIAGNDRNGLHANAITRIYIDRSQCLWACTFGSGVNYCDLNQKRFYTIQYTPGTPYGLSGNYIRSILDEDGRYLWIGTSYNGLNRYDFSTGQCTYFSPTTTPVKLQAISANALLLDKDHNLWIGSAEGIQILKPDRRQCWNPPGSEDFPRHVIDVITQDCYGNIWFGDHEHPFGVIWRDKGNRFHVRYYGEGYFILSDPIKPILFVSSTHGLKRLIVDKEGNILETDDYQATGQPNTLSSNYTYPVCKKDDSTYWIGTIGGGLDRLVVHKDASPVITTYGREAGIFTDVEALEIDDAGNIWMGGNGLQCFNPATGQLIRYDKNDGLQGNSFKVNASYKGSDGRLYFGGINGLNYFNPADIKPNPIPALPALTDLLINNRSPLYGQPDSTGVILDGVLGYTRELRLNYLQNNFVLFFSAMHYANPLRCQYRYKLIGYDKDWKYTDGANPSAAYSNLDYSRYTFVLEATNNDGIWSSVQATLPITVSPPWWKSLPAKIVYAALFITGLLWIYFYQARWYRLKRELALREVNEKHYQQQLQFFTNISHEFRTPLTLILGPLEGLMKEDDHPAYQLMFRNVKRLINLINELMNFKKVADTAVKLQVRPLVIGSFCKSVYLEFENLAVSKNIRFTILDQTTGQETPSNYFDPQVLEKILFNLLNNALKYTNEGGEVTFRVFFDRAAFKPSFSNEYHLRNEQHEAARYIYFLIADTGVGISRDSIGDIFDRYYRISKDHLGSGVGLALVKSLTQLHKGNISVYSDRHRGTEILVALPWGKDAYTAGEILTPGREEAFSQLEPLDVSILTPVPFKASDTTHIGAKRILLVDDNAELRVFLRQSLERFYTVYEAEDGNAAIAIAIDKIPDLIISDVMMPGMSGIELCKLVKEKFETSHIPFIILSAKDALDTKIEGMESGADYYFSKPLSIDLLLLTVHNIFEQAQKLKLKYTNDYLTEATELVHTEKDKDFMQKLLALIEANIQEPDLDVEFLCNHLYISRTKLYQKIKSVSDQSIGDFIKTIRLKKAIQIMTHEDIPLNKVADRIGLQSHSYFSRVFKKEFGVSPSQFLDSLKKNG